MSLSNKNVGKKSKANIFFFPQDENFDVTSRETAGFICFFCYCCTPLYKCLYFCMHVMVISFLFRRVSKKSSTHSSILPNPWQFFRWISKYRNYFIVKYYRFLICGFRDVVIFMKKFGTIKLNDAALIRHSVLRFSISSAFSSSLDCEIIFQW